jgi:DNA-binding MarR family transcriptional regulator
MAKQGAQAVAKERPSDAQPPILLDNQLCFMLYASSRRMTSAYRPFLEPLGLTYPQYLVMIVLWERDDITVSDLCSRLMLDFGTLTPLLKRLQAKDLIWRERSKADERHVIVRLTRTGRAMAAKAKHIPASLRCQIDLPQSRTSALRSDLRDLLASFIPLKAAG